uniref:Integrase catalytic domain-containing protein n=1 Tax=Lactuca sativa TaxID=4236 RepID=A0A9R1UJC5_LACSA|nr:hypothetical protein LSAT_V11C900493310 [Lactuca sativa]
MESYNYKRVGMHDHLVEMGRNIVRYSHPDMPYKHSRLWMEDEIEDIFVNDLELRFLRVSLNWTDSTKTLIDTLLDHYPKHFKQIILLHSSSLAANFITKLPKIAKQNDSIWVTIDRLTKSAHFLAMRQKTRMEKYAQVYLDEIVARHGVPLKIITDGNTRFTSHFWASMQRELGSQVALSTTYHPQTDDQTERTIQTVEDILHACEALYNNSYHVSIKMPPYEALYGCKCRMPLGWRDIGQKILGGPEMNQDTTNKIQIVQERMKAAQD